MIRDILKGFGRQRAALTLAFDALDEVRNQIAAKAGEIEALRASPRPVDEALRLFDVWADGAATHAIDRLPLRRLLDSRNPAPSLETEILRMPGEITPNSRADVEMLVGMVFLIGRDHLRQVIAGQLGDLVQGRETLSDPERAERIAQARADLRALEMTEEAVIRRMVDAGITVQRRANAPAIALLADDASLPT